MLNTVWSDDVEVMVQLELGRTGEAIFTLDDDPLGRLDGEGRLGSPDAPYDDSTCDVRSMTWRAGATRGDGVLTRWEAGTATIVLDNTRNQYDVTAPDTRLLPMVGVRIRAREVGSSTWLPMWSGFADAWNCEWTDDGDATVTLIASDGVKHLTKYDAPEQPPVGSGETSAQRITRILDDALWTDGRRITAGGYALQSTTMAQDSWTQVLLVQDAELGAAFVDKDGAFVFVPRNFWITPDQAASQKWGPNDLRYEHADIVNDDMTYRNIVDAARTGGTVVSVRNQADVNKFQPRRYGRSDLPFLNDSDVASWANIVLQTSLSLAPRVDQMEVLPQIEPTELWPVVLGAQYADRWQVEVNPADLPTAVVRTVQVRGWQHTVTPEQWRVIYYLSDAQLFQPFQLDSTNPNATLDVMRLI